MCIRRAGGAAEATQGEPNAFGRLQLQSNGDIEANRAYVGATLGLEVWSHALYQAAKAHPHERDHGHEN